MACVDDDRGLAMVDRVEMDAKEFVMSMTMYDARWNV